MEPLLGPSHALHISMSHARPLRAAAPYAPAASRQHSALISRARSLTLQARLLLRCDGPDDEHTFSSFIESNAMPDCREHSAS